MAYPQRYLVIACEIMFREVSLCAARSRNVIDVSFMPKGLHDIGEVKMSARLQAEIDKVDASRYAAILLAYGLCNNGIRGLHAGCPMVAPRAHDCITLLLGSKEKYADYFATNAGTYYYSPGWIERDAGSDGGSDNIMTQLGINRSYDEYVAKYGEKNAKYLMEVLGDWTKNYKKLAYIDTGVGDPTALKAHTQAEAEKRGWEYEELQGNLLLLQRLVDGEWDADAFLVIPPEQTLKPTYDDKIIGLK